MKTLLVVLAALVCTAASSLAAAQLTLYQQQNFVGRAFAANGPVSDLGRMGFNDRASSVIVERGQWQVCDDIAFRGYCIVLRPGQYPSLAAMGLNNRISSLRRVGGGGNYAYAPPPPAAPYPYYPHHGERLYPADVLATRAVVGPPEQRCWVEHQTSERSGANVPGAIAGAVIGGILGHQVGSGRGNDVATVGGAVAGAAIGANVNRDHGAQYGQDVQRCENVPSQSRTEYWDVTYDYRGQEHRVQLTAPPGPTITVNGQGEPRA